MKRLNRLTFIGAIIIGLSACQEESKTPAVTQDSDQEKMEKIMNVAPQKIWKANIETTQGFTKMYEMVSEFSDFENVEAYTQLKENLMVEYKLIFKNCTMKGEAHERLHDYIMPFSGWFKGLSSGELETCKSSYDAIKLQLEDYSNHFE
ncbi:hypothetical protein KFE94_15545 [bacterium SCSIO 12643]|nr:hypothetical protein KFE94_15545 [bacterium SCSIO 12643]